MPKAEAKYYSKWHRVKTPSPGFGNNYSCTDLQVFIFALNFVGRNATKNT